MQVILESFMLILKCVLVLLHVVVLDMLARSGLGFVKLPSSLSFPR